MTETAKCTTVRCLPDQSCCNQVLVQSAHEGHLSRELTLRNIDFEVDAEESLWQRWYLELERRIAAGQTPAALPCGSADDFMLLNW